MNFRHPTGRDPKKVNLLCLGPSLYHYLATNLARHDAAWPADEIWGLNVGLHHLKVDCGFVLDDINWLEEFCPEHVENLRNLHYPVFVQGIERFTGFRIEENGDPFVTFPLTKIGITHGMRMMEYLHNSVPLVLAYALMIGVRELRLFGADYTYDGQERERGRGNLEFWIGYALAQGLDVRCGPGSTLLDTDQSFWIYGLHKEHPAATRRRLEWAIADKGKSSDLIFDPEEEPWDESPSTLDRLP